MLPGNASDWDSTHPSSKTSGPRRAGGLLILLGLLVVLIGVVAVAATRLPTGALSRPETTAASAPSKPGAAAAPAPVGVTADAPTQQAIQQVIQRLDEAQAKAIATNDQTVMADAAMPAFYAEEVQTNKDLVAGGVTEVKLVKAEWGDITTDGTTATATVYETWSTTFADGTTEQARDRNVYTLVQDDGTWKVQADVHPDSPAAPAATSGQ